MESTRLVNNGLPPLGTSQASSGDLKIEKKTKKTCKYNIKGKDGDNINYYNVERDFVFDVYLVRRAIEILNSGCKIISSNGDSVKGESTVALRTGTTEVG